MNPTTATRTRTAAPMTIHCLDEGRMAAIVAGRGWHHRHSDERASKPDRRPRIRAARPRADGGDSFRVGLLRRRRRRRAHAGRQSRGVESSSDSGRASWSTSRRSTSTASAFGATLAHPVIVAPTAAHDLAHPDAELATARGAAAAGALMTLSTISSRSMEEVAAAARCAALVPALQPRRSGGSPRARRACRRRRATRPWC